MPASCFGDSNEADRTDGPKAAPNAPSSSFGAGLIIGGAGGEPPLLIGDACEGADESCAEGGFNPELDDSDIIGEPPAEELVTIAGAAIADAIEGIGDIDDIDDMGAIDDIGEDIDEGGTDGGPVIDALIGAIAGG